MSARILWVPGLDGQPEPVVELELDPADAGSHHPPAHDVRRAVHLLEITEWRAGKHVALGHEVQRAGDPRTGLHPGGPTRREWQP